jgi:Cytochrome c7 and related cytochrome c
MAYKSGILSIMIILTLAAVIVAGTDDKPAAVDSGSEPVVESTGETVAPSDAVGQESAGTLQMALVEINTEKYRKTSITFTHLKHAEEYAKGCEDCHPVLASVYQDESNDKTLVHKVCKQCHATGKPAKSFKCSTCHQ